MSDVSVTNAPPSAPAPTNTSDQNRSQPSNEVMINQNPVSSQNAVGPQAPPAHADHEGSKHRPESRREALQKAFERASNPQAQRDRQADKPAPRAAEARVGHNQPPEDTPKLDLKKRPDDQPQAAPRGEGGRFAPRTDRTNRTNVQNVQNVQQGEQPYKELPPHAPFHKPPVRASEAARREWHATPEAVRGDIHRLQKEFAQAYKYYKDDYEAFKPIKAYHQLAQSQGTSLEAALAAYTKMEHRLRSDPIAALDVIVQNLDLKDPKTGQPIGLRDVAYYVLNRSPEQMRQVQQSNVQQAAAQQIGALHQEIAGLKNYLTQVHTQQQFSYTRSAVDQFADTHPRFDELGDLIEQELKIGYDLETAYQRAALLRPATHAAQTRTTSAQTRPTDRSIYGAPGAASSNGATRRPKEASRSPREALMNAMARVNGA